MENPGIKKSYSRSSFSIIDNLVNNPDFSVVPEFTGWTAHYLDTSDPMNPLNSITVHNDKTWLRLDCSIAQEDPSTQGYMQQVINIPLELRYAVLEISLLVCGMFTNITVANQDFEPVYISIDPAYGERIYYYYRPNGASTFTLNLNKNYPGQETAEFYVDYTEIQVKKADVNLIPISHGLPATGSNMQYYLWLNNWDASQQIINLSGYSKIGGVLRVWLSCEHIMSFEPKSDPVKKTISSTYLTTSYQALTVAKKPTGIDPVQLGYLDWFFDNCSSFGIKLQVVLGGGYGVDTGLGITGLYEFLDTDSDVQTGFITLVTDIVLRYKSYDNIIGWELFNEGYVNWRESFSGITPNAPYSSIKCTTFTGYRAFERAAYDAIKTIDPLRPVILNEGYCSWGQILAGDDVCDWYCPSYYPGLIQFQSNSTVDGNNKLHPARGYSGQLTSGLVANTKVLAFAYTDGGNALPIELDADTYYYIINIGINNFQIAATEGGTPLVVNAGTGTWYLYADDGGTLGAQDYVLQRAADDPKFVGLSEFGAGTTDGLYLYRDDTINSLYVKKIAERLQKYGIAYCNIWGDTDQPLFDNYADLNASGTVMSHASISTYPQTLANDFLDNIDLHGVTGSLPVNVSQYSPGSTIIPSFRQFFESQFDGVTVQELGAHDFGIHDNTQTSPFRVGARVSAYSTSAWSGSDNHAPSKLIIEIQGDDGVDYMDGSNPVFEFDQGTNRSNQNFLLNSNAWNKNLMYWGGLRAWRNNLGVLTFKDDSDPSSDTDGCSVFPLRVASTDADYTITTAQVICILGVITASRTVNLPNLSDVVAGSYITLINRNSGNSYNWSANVAMRNFDGNDLTVLKNNTAYVVFADPASSVWRVVGCYHGEYYNQAEADARYGHLANFTASGDGTSTNITIPHGLSGVNSSSVVLVNARNATSAGFSYIDIDSTNIYIYYSVPPGSGTNNLKYSIQIKN